MKENKNLNSPKRSKVVVLVGTPAGVPDYVIKHLLLSKMMAETSGHNRSEAHSCKRCHPDECLDLDSLFKEMIKEQESAQNHTTPKNVPHPKRKVVRLKARKIPQNKPAVSQTLVSEVCPYCNRENTFNWDVKTDGMIAFCPNCAHPMHLCSMCEEEKCGNSCPHE